MAFQSRGVRALVKLQLAEMHQLFAVWKRAKRVGVRLPATRDPAYKDLDALMAHPLRSCRGYLTWLCEVLGRPEAVVPEAPKPADVAGKGAAYLGVLERAWEKHMAWMPARVLDSTKVHQSRWGAPMTVEAMFEHALAHPMRHRFQLEELIARAKPRKPAAKPAARRGAAKPARRKKR